MTIDVILFTEDYQGALGEIETLGGRVTHKFSDTIMVAKLPESVNIDELDKSQTSPPSKMDHSSELIVAAWKAKEDKARKERAPSKVEDLSWGTPGYQAPRNPTNDPKLAAEEEKFNRSGKT